MDLREEDKRFAERQSMAGCASALHVLAILLGIIGVGAAAMILGHGFNRDTMLIAFLVFVGPCAVAALIWAVSLILIWQTRIEENTRAAADALEKLAATRRDPLLSDLTTRDTTSPTDDTDG